VPQDSVIHIKRCQVFNKRFIKSIHNVIDIQDFKSVYDLQYSYGRIWEKILGNMKEEYNTMSAKKILHEANRYLKAARQHASELSEVG